MGWGRMLLLGNLGQQLDINDTQQALASLAAQSRAANRFDQDVAKTVNELSQENAELKLYLAAIIRLLTKKQLITREELTEIVNAIDQSDGSKDGKLQAPIKTQI